MCSISGQCFGFTRLLDDNINVLFHHEKWLVDYHLLGESFSLYSPCLAEMWAIRQRTLWTTVESMRRLKWKLKQLGRYWGKYWIYRGNWAFPRALLVEWEILSRKLWRSFQSSMIQLNRFKIVMKASKKLQSFKSFHFSTDPRHWLERKKTLQEIAVMKFSFDNPQIS